MEFNEAYTAVHNMIHQNEALLALRDHLEKAKDVENFVKSSSQEINKIEKEVSDLESYRSQIVEEISEKKLAGELEETRRTKELQAKLDRMRSNFENDQGQRAKDLEDQITQNKMEMVSLKDAIQTGQDDLKTVQTETRTAIAELKAVQEALSQIKNSIGG